MVISTALLVREQGARATSIDDVLAHSGAPRVGLPPLPRRPRAAARGGDDYAGDASPRRIERPPTRSSCSTLLHELREQLIASDFRAGCPIVAVAVEAGDPESDLHEQPAPRSGAGRVARGQARGRRRGPRAAELACSSSPRRGRARPRPDRRDPEPLDSVHSQLRALLRAEPTKEPRMTDNWQPTACILCECNCGIEVQLEGRTLRIRGDKAHPGRRATPATRRCGSITTRTAAPADLAAAPPRRTAATRKSAGTRRSPRSPRVQALRDQHGGE